MYRICYSVNSGARQKVCIPVRLCRPCTDYSAVCVVVAVKDRLLCRHIQLSAESVDTRMSTSSISSSSRGSQLQPHVSTARWVARSAQRPSKTQKQPNLSLNSEFTVKKQLGRKTAKLATLTARTFDDCSMSVVQSYMKM